MGIAVGNISSSLQISNQTIYTFNHTCGAGTNLLIVTTRVFDATAGDAAVSGITYDGDALTKGIDVYDAASDFGIEVWYLVNPTIGGALVVQVTHGGEINRGSGGAIALSGANTSDVVDLTDTEITVNDLTLDFTGRATDSLAVGAIILDDGSLANLSVLTGTEAEEVDIGVRVTGSAYNDGDTIVWSCSNNDCVGAGITINPAVSRPGFSSSMIKNWIFMKDAWEKHNKIWTPKIALPKWI